MGALTTEDLDRMRTDLASAYKVQAFDLIDRMVQNWSPAAGRYLTLKLEVDEAVYREITKPPERS